MRNLTNAIRQLTRRPGLPAVIVAIILPARKASRIAPMSALRYE